MDATLKLLPDPGDSCDNATQVCLHGAEEVSTSLRVTPAVCFVLNSLLEQHGRVKRSLPAVVRGHTRYAREQNDDNRQPC